MTEKPCPDCQEHYESRCPFHQSMDAARERLQEVRDAKHRASSGRRIRSEKP